MTLELGLILVLFRLQENQVFSLYLDFQDY